MANLCIIPARGGSKRIPRKNLRPFRGVPIIEWSIRAALASHCFDDIVLSTDDEEIAAVGQSLGAWVPFFRYRETATDHATTAEVLVETLARLEDLKKYYHAVCCLYPTAPFTTAQDLQIGLAKLDTDNFEVILPITRFQYSIWRSFKLHDDSRVEMNWPEQRDARSQDLPQAFHDAGQWCWFRPATLFKNGSLIGPSTGSVTLPAERVQDIDEEEDWQLAEWKHERIFG
jgi:pseudaminic acid cytidylyltransferase